MTEATEATKATSTIRVVETTRAGSADRLRVIRVPRPVAGPGELLIRVKATSVTRGDVVMRKMPSLVVRAFGEKPKRVLGHEFAGVIAEVGQGVVGWEVGTRVFGTTSGTSHGAHAEFVVSPADGLVVPIPEGVAYTEVATVPVGAMAALHFLTSGGIAPESNVLVNGASGSVGSYAVQIAKAKGARVVGVSSGSHLDTVRGLGADEVVDYATTDVLALDQRFDIVFDAAGVLRARSVGAILGVGGSFVTTKTRRDETRDELKEVARLIGEGSIRSVIGSTYDLENVPDAHRLAETGHKLGNILIMVEHEGPNEQRSTADA